MGASLNFGLKYTTDMEVRMSASPSWGLGPLSSWGGSGKTATQQECLDMMLRSYSLCTHKVKSPNRLCIVCRPQEGFSINKIGLV